MTEKYNGWYDWDTWNCALWILGDESMYNMAKICKTYDHFQQRIRTESTPDGARWEDAHYPEMNRLIEEINQ